MWSYELKIESYGRRPYCSCTVPTHEKAQSVVLRPLQSHPSRLFSKVLAQPRSEAHYCFSQCDRLRPPLRSLSAPRGPLTPPTMFPLALRAVRARTCATAPLLRASVSTATSSNQVPANDPVQRDVPPNVSQTNATPTSSEGSLDKGLQEDVVTGERLRTEQAPNYKGIWSRSQNPREVAMRGPRFEGTIMEDQPRPYAAIELIHKQPVRWSHDKMVSCDGGGGPLGHPRIFINLDKPQINVCTYCGLPFANEKHRSHLESLPESELSYPLGPRGDAAEVHGT